MNQTELNALRSLVDGWRKSSHKYWNASNKEFNLGSKLDGNRYEGESHAFNWCADDLEKILKTVDRPED